MFWQKKKVAFEGNHSNFWISWIFVNNWSIFHCHLCWALVVTSRSTNKIGSRSFEFRKGWDPRPPMCFDKPQIAGHKGRYTERAEHQSLKVGCFKYVSFLSRFLGKWSKFHKQIFQMGWKQQLELFIDFRMHLLSKKLTCIPPWEKVKNRLKSAGWEGISSQQGTAIDWGCNVFCLMQLLSNDFQNDLGISVWNVRWFLSGIPFPNGLHFRGLSWLASITWRTDPLLMSSLGV